MSNANKLTWQRLSTESMPAADAIAAAAASGGGYGLLRRLISGTLQVLEIEGGQKLTFLATGDGVVPRTAIGYNILCRLKTGTGEELVYPIPAPLFKVQDNKPVAPAVLTFTVDEETGKVKFAAGAGAPAANTTQNVVKD